MDITNIKSDIEVFVNKEIDTKEKKAAALSLLVGGAALTAFVSLSIALTALSYPLLTLSTTLLVGCSIALALYIASHPLDKTDTADAEAVEGVTGETTSWVELSTWEPQPKRDNPLELPPTALEEALRNYYTDQTGTMPLHRQYG